MIEFLICIIAGIGAGIGNGLAGLSSAVVVSPMLIAFLNVEPYEAIGIALASDVLASAASAYTYGKNKNLDIKNGLIILFSVLVFTFLGSFAASYMPSKAMGGFSMLMTLFLGIKFMVRPVMTTKDVQANKSVKQKIIQSILVGSVIGFTCGFVGAGGGMMILMALTLILGYELKTAVGTSVFIMAFTALTGAVSHFAISKSLPDIEILVTCIITTLIAAKISSSLANKASPKTLNRITGAVLTVLALTMIIVEFVKK